jgi:predicted nuclease of predicted toxin-antitoxin system
MNFFSDHDVYGQTIKFLHAHGHAVARAQDVGLADAEDLEILRYATNHNLILLTRDSDFGILVFQQQEYSRGVIFLRVHPITLHAVHQQLLRVLAELTEAELYRSFISVEATRYRLRKLP